MVDLLKAGRVFARPRHAEPCSAQQTPPPLKHARRQGSCLKGAGALRPSRGFRGIILVSTLRRGYCGYSTIPLTGTAFPRTPAVPIPGSLQDLTVSRYRIFSLYAGRTRRLVRWQGMFQGLCPWTPASSKEPAMRPPDAGCRPCSAASFFTSSAKPASGRRRRELSPEGQGLS